MVFLILGSRYSATLLKINMDLTLEPNTVLHPTSTLAQCFIWLYGRNFQLNISSTDPLACTHMKISRADEITIIYLK